jgi:hypothetical protein
MAHIIFISVYFDNIHVLAISFCIMCYAYTILPVHNLDFMQRSRGWMRNLINKGSLEESPILGNCTVFHIYKGRMQSMILGS